MISKTALVNYLLLLLLTAVFILLFFAVNLFFPGLAPPGETITLSTSFAFISLTALAIFYTGSAKNPERSVFMTFVALGVKMLLSFVLAMLWFLVFKNRGTDSILLFFVLYLGFTLFVVLSFLRVLKHNTLKEE